MSLPFRAKAYVVLLGMLALALIAYFARDLAFLSTGRILAFFLFLVLGFLSEIYAVWIPAYGGEVSSSIAIYMASLFILGPALAVLLVLATTLASELMMRWENLRSSPSRFLYVLVFNVSQLVVTVGITGVVFFRLIAQPLELAATASYLWAMLAFLCYAALNVGLVTTVVTLTAKKLCGT